MGLSRVSMMNHSQPAGCVRILDMALRANPNILECEK